MVKIWYKLNRLIWSPSRQVTEIAEWMISSNLKDFFICSGVFWAFCVWFFLNLGDSHTFQIDRTPSFTVGKMLDSYKVWSKWHQVLIYSHGNIQAILAIPHLTFFRKIMAAMKQKKLRRDCGIWPQVCKQEACRMNQMSDGCNTMSEEENNKVISTRLFTMKVYKLYPTISSWYFHIFKTGVCRGTKKPQFKKVVRTLSQVFKELLL